LCSSLVLSFAADCSNAPAKPYSPPVANFAKQLKHLVGYPHGCLEQTTSKAFPQIYLRDIASVLDPTILNTGSPTYFVTEAISKITSMQQPNGYFSYWPGEYSKNQWAMVYAIHFLFEVKKAGYVVSEPVLMRMSPHCGVTDEKAKLH